MCCDSSSRVIAARFSRQPSGAQTRVGRNLCVVSMGSAADGRIRVVGRRGPTFLRGPGRTGRFQTAVRVFLVRDRPVRMLVRFEFDALTVSVDDN